MAKTKTTTAATTTTTTRKRKATTADTETANKKLKLMEEGAERVEAILASNFEMPEGTTAIRQTMLELAQYARSLEEEVVLFKPKPKTAADLEAETNKLRAAVRSAIVKQMTWKTSCKTNSAKWVYDGVCNDPQIFGQMLKLDGPPTFKMKKFPRSDFLAAIGNVRASARYSELYLQGDINVRWPGDGTFKLSGSYGSQF